MNKSKASAFFAAASILFFASNADAQTGGNFTITQSVVAAGGASNSAGGIFSLGGTIGQPIAENAPASGGAFSLRSGFWFAQFAPTAAAVSISGRVRVAGGAKGIRNAQLVLTNTTTGETRQARSGFFGAYRFDDLPVGQTYILTVSARRFSFAEDTRVVTLVEELTDVDFLGSELF